MTHFRLTRFAILALAMWAIAPESGTAQAADQRINCRLQFGHGDGQAKVEAMGLRVQNGRLVSLAGNQRALVKGELGFAPVTWSIGDRTLDNAAVDEIGQLERPTMYIRNQFDFSGMPSPSGSIDQNEILIRFPAFRSKREPGIDSYQVVAAGREVFRYAYDFKSYAQTGPETFSFFKAPQRITSAKWVYDAAIFDELINVLNRGEAIRINVLRDNMVISVATFQTRQAGDLSTMVRATLDKLKTQAITAGPPAGCWTVGS